MDHPLAQDILKVRSVARSQALQLGLNRTEADDVVQITSLLLLQNWSAIERPRAWARTVARRTSMKVVGRRMLLLDATFHDTAVCPETEPEARLDVTRAFANLSDEAQALWWSRCIDETPWDDVAACHGTSQSTVKRKNRRTTRLLQNRLGA